MMRCRLLRVVLLVLGLLGIVSKGLAQEVAVVSTSIDNADTVTHTAGGEEQTILITLGLTVTGESAGSITRIDVYFTDNVEFEDSTAAKTSEAFPKEFNPAKEVPIGTTDNTDIIKGEEVAVLIDVEKCREYTHTCIVITADGDTNPDDNDGCLPFGDTVGTHSGVKLCPDIAAEQGSFKITAPSPSTITYNTFEDTAITFDIKASATDGAGTVTDVNLYFTNSDNYYAATVKSDAFKADNVPSTSVPDEGESEITGATAALKLDVDQCTDYDHLCAVLVVSTTDTDAENNADCTEFGSGSDKAGASDCSHIGIVSDSFKITDPSSYTITTHTAVEMTYEIGLTNTGGSLDTDVTAIDLYLSDDKDLTTASSEFPSDEDDFPLKIASGSDGSTPSTGLSASVTADGEQCDKYVFLCAKVTPNAAVECIDVKDEIDCQDSGVASLSAKHCILVTTLVAMVKIVT